MSNSKLKNIRNQIDFKKETNLYFVEPLVGSTPSWFNLSDVSNTHMAIPLHFQELKGKKLFAKFVRDKEDEKSCWKMFIVDNSSVSILYVEPGALNPIGKYQP